MVPGFNHNLQYKGEIFHVQTEDSGVANPHIITLLYRGGIILCSQKTSYSDIVKSDCLDVVVEELMKEQHKNMMRRLKSGEFDDKAFAIKPQLIENYEIPTLEPESVPVVEQPESPSAEGHATEVDISSMFEVSSKATKHNSSGTTASQNSVNLDDAILSFFGGPDKKNN